MKNCETTRSIPKSEFIKEAADTMKDENKYSQVLDKNASQWIILPGNPVLKSPSTLPEAQERLQ